MKKIISLILSALATVYTATVVFSAGYYNATNEVNQIKSFMRRGMYLEVIRDSNNTKSWHYLSPDDISLLDNYISEATKRYNDYVNGTGSYYNASAEINQIKSFTKNGLYIEAMQNCEKTLDWHYLSPSDIALLNSLYDDANNKYNAYKQRNDPINKTKNTIQGYWFNAGDPYTQSTNIQFNSDGSFYLRTWRVEEYGTYTITAANKIYVTYDMYFKGAGSSSFYYDSSDNETYTLSGGKIVDKYGMTYEKRNSFTSIYGQE